MGTKIRRRDLTALLATSAISCANQRPGPVTQPHHPVSRRIRYEEPASFPPLRMSMAYPWQPDQGDGTYQNPVIFGDYSDPDVIRVGYEYYLIASSFNCTPGLPILRSRDLVNWTLVGHALKNLPDPRYAEVQHGCGIWAPAIREHAGLYYIFAPTPDEGIYVLTAKHPLGPWSEPRMLLAGKGLIDPCPLWDDDGKAYLVHAYARSRAGIKNRLRVRPMSPDAKSVLGVGEIVFHDPETQPTIEGPKFHKRNGWYYILAPAGGVKNGWQLALRSRNIYGPYEAMTVLQQGSTPINGPHQGALVDTPAGRWFFLHFQDAGIYGRIVHLNPVSWRNDWPLMGASMQRINVDATGVSLRHPWSPASIHGVRAPVLRSYKPVLPEQPIAVPQTTDEFDQPALGLQWQWHANHEDDWASLSARPGHLRLKARPQPGQLNFANTPNLLLQKLPASSFWVETEVELVEPAHGLRAGLIVMGERHAALSADDDGATLRISLRSDGLVLESVELPRGPVKMLLSLSESGECQFRFSAKGRSVQPIGDTFRAVPGKWIGTKVGLFAVAGGDRGEPGHADFSYFRFSRP